jgi:hypothetical protein
MRFIPFIVVVLAVASTAVAQPTDVYRFEMPEDASAASLRLLAPDGRIHDLRFAHGETIEIGNRLDDETSLPDGLYQWELHFTPIIDGELREGALMSREAGDAHVPDAWPETIDPESGIFLVENGRFVAVEEDDREAEALERAQILSEPERVTIMDQVIPDDLVVQGSICAGFDCINNESFGFDTMRLKENNLRISFVDTSVGTFPSGDWQLRANDSASGGQDHFSLDWLGTDATGGQNANVVSTPFRVMGGAPDHALYVSASGRVGLRTSTPVLDLHINTGNTPAMRLEQNIGGGWGVQTWDVAGNEANFFVRDVTNGSRLPLRIRPGAPTSSLDINAVGNVGMGIGSPQAALHLRRPLSNETALLRIDVPDDGNPATEDRRLQLDAAGNLFVSGAITQLSSRSAKGDLMTIASEDLLGRLRDLPIWTWSYLHSSGKERHIGPVAEDFYQMFGLGQDERSMSPSDVAGVALAAAQALQQQVAERDRTIEGLEARLSRLEALLDRSDADHGTGR